MSAQYLLASRYRRMAFNNRWSNYRLLGACARLTDAERAAPRIGFFPSLVATLNHILIVDWYYVDALAGGTLGPAAFANEIPHPDFAALAAAQFDVDLRLIALCKGYDDAALAEPVRMDRGSQGMQVETAEDVLLHLFTHQIHHRGQAHAMLSGTDVKPPQLDEFYPVWDAPLRVDDERHMLHRAHL